MARILLMDDDELLREALRIVLQGAGYEVMEAKDGQDALAKLTVPLSLSMVVTDLNMPAMDGIGLIQRLRAHPNYKYVPIVVLTTESAAAKKQAARSAGATAWIVKPFRPEQLVAVVQKVLG